MSNAEDSAAKPGMFGKYGEEVPQFVLDCFEASSEGGRWVGEEIEWESIFSHVHASSSLRVPPGTEEDVHKAFCIPLAMYTLVDHTCTRNIAYKLSFIMIMMIFCPVYEVDSAGNILSPTKATRGRIDRFLFGEWRESWKDCQEHPSLQVKTKPSRGYNEEEEAYRRAQKANHAVLNGQVSNGARALVQPGLLKWSQHIV